MLWLQAFTAGYTATLKSTWKAYVRWLALLSRRMTTQRAAPPFVASINTKSTKWSPAIINTDPIITAVRITSVITRQVLHNYYNLLLASGISYSKIIGIRTSDEWCLWEALLNYICWYCFVGLISINSQYCEFEYQSWESLCALIKFMLIRKYFVN